MAEQRGDWMQTASGRRFFVTAPGPEDIDIGDIAHALSQLCRFGGHTREFYSVAQHCHLVSTLVPGRLALYGLLHDAAEAYLGDVVHPLKRAIGSVYTPLELRVELVIAHAFGLRTLSVADAAVVKRADLVALATERRDVMRTTSWTWDLVERVAPSERVIAPYRPRAARELFLRRFEELTGGTVPR